MEDLKGRMICEEYGRERGRQENTRDLWQRTGDTIWPYVQIDLEFTPGTSRTREIYDTTPTLDMLDMVSGFKQVLMPAGQTFFVITPVNKNISDASLRYLNMATEIAHEKMFASNLTLVMDQTLVSLICFGPGGIFTQYIPGKGLHYKSPKIGSYVMYEDQWENVIGSIHEFKLSAMNAYHLYGERSGSLIKQSALDGQHGHDEFKFLYKVMPNDDRDPLVSSCCNTNMPYAATVVAQREKVVVDEGGFTENPYAFARWMRPEYEKDGRGIGTEMLPQIKILFDMNKDFNDCGNRWNHPPRQILIDGIEGQVDARPDANNWVTEINAVQALDQNLNGNFPITEKSLERQTMIIDRAFFKNAFDPLADLKGDRRTTLEIQERIRGTLKKLGPPTTRIWHEQISPVIERSVLELIRNGEIPPPPAELKGAGFGIEYIGPLALALKSEQARGLQEWMNFVAGAHAAFPEAGIADNIDFDDAVPRIGRTFGVNIEDIASNEERDAKRAKRAQDLKQQQQMQMAESMGKAYKDGSGAAEPGSPAGKMMEEAV